MPALLNTVDPEGLEEFSVVFTDRSLNHMSTVFQSVMTDISAMLKQVYNADAVALIPGGGTFGMEAVGPPIWPRCECLGGAQRLVFLSMVANL
jgi:aspartate aminotransferase-like enzyme